MSRKIFYPHQFLSFNYKFILTNKLETNYNARLYRSSPPRHFSTITTLLKVTCYTKHRTMRTLSSAIYTTAGVMSDVETLLNTHLIVQRKQSAGTRARLAVDSLPRYRGKTGEPCDDNEETITRGRARASGIIGARLEIDN